MSAAPYDPELPFLAELERHVRQRAEESARSAQAVAGRSRQSRLAGRLDTPPARHAPAPAWSVRRQAARSGTTLARRMIRRTAILAGLLCLLAASALGAHAVFFARPESPAAVHAGARVTVAGAHAGEERWTLSVYTRAGELCSALIVLSQQAASRCGPAPGARGFGVTSLASPARRYLFGVAGGDVRGVLVRAGAARLKLHTYPLEGGGVRTAGIPGGARYFVGSLARPAAGEDPPALVVGLDASGRRTGEAHVSCVESAAAAACRTRTAG